MAIHTIPVPTGWSPEQAWERIHRGHKIPDVPIYWANIDDHQPAPPKTIPPGGTHTPGSRT